MSEDIKAGINEILDDVDQLLTEEYIEGVTLWDLVLGAFYEAVEERVLYGNDWAQVPNDNPMGEHELGSKKDKDDAPGEFIMCSRGSGKQSRINEYNFEAQMNNLSKAFELGGKLALDSSRGLGQSVDEWAEATYSVSPICLDSLTDTTEERARPRKRGERCNVCSNMTKKELKKHDSCPSCGRSLFALKSRGW